MRDNLGVVSNRSIIDLPNKLKNDIMRPLTKREMERQDFVDNEVFELIQRLAPSAKIKWDIELIGNVRDSIQIELADKQKLMSKAKFYPFVKYKDRNKYL